MKFPKHFFRSSGQLIQSRLRSRRARKLGLWLLIVIVCYGLLGFFAVPLLVRRYGTPILSQSLSRPTSIGSVSFNPYTLRFEIDRFRVHQKQGQGDFIAFDKLVVRPSWSSLFRLKPIINEVWLDVPKVRIVRSAPHTFNFSDLIEKYSKPGKSGGKPLRFSVSNIHIDDGSIVFDDRVLGKQHEVTHLRLGIPFIANLPSKTDIFVQPLLQARIDGNPLLIFGHTKPFSDSREADMTLKLDQIGLPPLMAYLPVSVPVVLQRGKLSTDLSLQFVITDGTPRISVSGSVRLDDLAVTDTHAQPLLDVRSISVSASSIEPLRSVFHLSTLTIDQPHLFLARAADGNINLTQLQPKPAGPSQQTTTTPAPVKPAKATAATPLDFSLARMTLHGGSVQFKDQKTKSPTKFNLTPLDLTLNHFSTLGNEAAAYEVQATLTQNDNARGSLSVQGSMIYSKHQIGSVIALKGLSLPIFQLYLESMLAGHLDRGTLSAKTQLAADWSAPALKLTANNGEIKLSGLQISGADRKQSLIQLAQADARIQQIDLSSKHAELPSITLQGLSARIQRNHDGSINLTSLIKTAGASKTKAAKPSGKASSAPTAAWTYHIGTFALNQSSVQFSDKSLSKPVAVQVSALQFKLQNISQGTHKPWPLNFSAAIKQGGNIAVGGTVTVAPLALRLHLDISKFNVATFEPYFGDRLNAVIASARLKVRGDAHLDKTGNAWTAAYDGDIGLGDVRMLDKQTSDVFAGWHRLKLSRIKASYAPQGTDFDVGEIKFSRFFARIFLDPQGKLNLSNFLAGKNTPSKSLTRVDKSAKASTPQVTKAASSTPSKTRFHIGGVVLDSGRIDYTDNFIKPNFSAKLIDINGKVGALGTQTTDAAAVALKAKLNTNGSVTIDGKVNPLAKTPYLDMKAHAENIELTQFATYSTKYTGYPIRKGKLQVDLNYLLDHGKLTAKNHLFIDQLTFGDHVDSSTASNLPVRFAVSLLKNRQGEIDLDIPVSGSLSDPQFNIGALVWHAVSNIITKAITSPFSLLASAFGGGSEKLSYLEFDPGSAVLTSKALDKLQTLKKALTDKPGIELDISGEVDPVKDLQGLREASVERQVKQQKLKDLKKKNKHSALANVSVSFGEYDKYLGQAYDDADFKKPTNFIGFTKSLPPAQMKTLMLENATVSDEDLRGLAQQRAAAVQDWFKGKVDGRRIFVVAPKVGSKSSASSHHPRVEFSLKR